MELLLKEKGYVKLSNAISDKELETGRNCFDNNKVNYVGLDEFIKDICIPKINSIIKWDIQFIQYRALNNNNLPLFNTDVLSTIPINKFTNDIFTLIIYLDKNQIEGVPGSQNVIKYTACEANKLRYEKLEMNPGDCLLFNSSILNKTINKGRLIQISNVFENKKKMGNIISLLVPINGRSNESVANLFHYLRNSPFSNLVSYFEFLNASKGYGLFYSKELINCLWNKTIILVDDNVGSLDKIVPGWFEDNLYVKNKKLNSVSKECEDLIRFEAYDRQYYYYILTYVINPIIFIILLILIAYKR